MTGLAHITPQKLLEMAGHRVGLTTPLELAFWARLNLQPKAARVLAQLYSATTAVQPARLTFADTTKAQMHQYIFAIREALGADALETIGPRYEGPVQYRLPWIENADFMAAALRYLGRA